MNDQTVTLAAVSPEDIPISESEPAIERVAEALLLFPDGATPANLSQELGIAEMTVRNHLTNLRKEGRVVPLGKGMWVATLPDSHPDDGTIGDGVGNSCSLN